MIVFVRCSGSISGDKSCLSFRHGIDFHAFQPVIGMLSDSISLRGAPLLSSLSEKGARASCLELYGAKGFIIAGRVRKGCNHPNYLISDTKVKRYRMSPRSPTIISRLTPCLFSDVNLIDKKKIRNCIYYIEQAFCRFISFYTTLNAAFFKMHKHL